MKIPQLEALKKSLAHPARMAVASGLAFLAAQILGLTEVYWAPIAALNVVNSDSNAMLATSWLLLAGTALGVCVGALLATSLGSAVVVFALGLFGMGLLSATVRLDRRANHFAAIALVIVLIAGPANLAWHRALHRFIEFSVGITVALLLNALWPEQQVTPGQAQPQDHAVKP
jgi:uncharacterized membrane protein YgaE (UPF0421/DUF939 family)